MPARKGQKYKPRTKPPEFNEVLRCALCERRFKRRHSQHKYCRGCKRKAALLSMKVRYEEKKNPERQRAYYKAYYEKNAEQIKERTKAYQQTERGKKAAKTTYQNQKKHNAKKIAARQAVKVALGGGRLSKQSCEVCGVLKVQAHHEDYDKPLEVRWLCESHHKQLHKSTVLTKVDTV